MHVITVKTRWTKEGEDRGMVQFISTVPMRLVIRQGSAVSSYPARTIQNVDHNALINAEIEMELTLEPNEKYHYAVRGDYVALLAFENDAERFGEHCGRLELQTVNTSFEAFVEEKWQAFCQTHTFDDDVLAAKTFRQSFPRGYHIGKRTG
jgi:hypothetical protein